MSQLVVKNLSVSYEQTDVLKDISFNQNKGEIIVILGASGDGKTTLLKAIAGLLKVNKGDILFEGEKVKDASAKLVPGHPKIKLVNQDFSLDKFHTVEENISLKLLQYNKEYKEKRVATLLQLTGLKKYKSLKAHQLSGGQQQRLAIARALADEPELLLLDEPFNQLDFQNKRKVESHIRSYLRKEKISAILVTHNGIEALEWADKIIFIRNGKIRRIDSPNDFFENPTNKYEASFFGELNKIKLKDADVYFRPGLFSLSKSKYFHTKVSVEFKSKLNLGWYHEYIFSSGGSNFKIFSQTLLDTVSEIFIHPINFKD